MYILTLCHTPHTARTTRSNCFHFATRTNPAARLAAPTIVVQLLGSFHFGLAIIVYVLYFHGVPAATGVGALTIANVVVLVMVFRKVKFSLGHFSLTLNSE